VSAWVNGVPGRAWSCRLVSCTCDDVSSAVGGLTQAAGNERPSVGLGAEEAQFKATSGVSVRRAAKELGGGLDE
jgi:hypothetical protein